MDLGGLGAFVWRPSLLDRNSWSQASKAERSGESKALGLSLRREPSLASFITAVSEVYCESRVYQSIDLSCFWSPSNPQMYMLCFILFIMYIFLYC